MFRRMGMNIIGDLNPFAALQAQQYSLGVRRYEFDWGLAPYNLHAWQQWRDLTSCLHARVVDEIQPVGGNICTAEEVALDDQGLEPGGRGDGVAGRSGREAEVRLRQQLREGQATRRAAATKIQTEASAAGAAKADTPIEPCSSAALSRYGGEDMKEETTAGRTETGGGTEERGPSQRAGNDGAAGRSHRPNPGLCRCFYSEIPRLVKAAGLNPAQLTALNMDRSRQMEALAAARWGGDMVAVVGEMQFAFIAFIFGQSLQGGVGPPCRHLRNLPRSATCPAVPRAVGRCTIGSLGVLPHLVRSCLDRAID
ncbi:hypothetical protein Vretifemale_17867 [Volvox reticuliferus]|uniref:Uncharacterized protein n=1 Tax=Volvox reticuliferus TaxID=1737510 RepID=A0A8J4FV06_9CHLO|nr:hypothetical protein Vretifemale_17867 [Volvox reticuliferus]